ncbi:MAG TPA: class I SAM-dependent methyltransferase [Thermoanaerobaculia bacterium]|nr:class I SAM-dependent methyltransferase [Thermoanaerobaculia bacterium]
MDLSLLEETLAKHPAVRRVRADGSGTVLIEPDPEGLSAGASESGHLSHWKSLWSGIYGESEAADPKLNLAGWVSSYTGRPIREAEMKDWVDHTVRRILELKPRRVLEIGCGMGLLLLRVAPQCEEYVGVDFSAEALQFVGARVEEEGLTEKVALRHGTAEDLGDLPDDCFDAVVVNSVLQYFPGLDYLLRVLEGALEKAAPGGHFFLGDIRSLPLLAAFHTAVQLQQVDSSLPLADLRQRVQSLVEQERELLLAPAFFPALARRFPKVAGATVQLKRGRPRNELTRFRYDAVLHLEGGTPPPPPPESWIDWGGPIATPAALKKHLAETAPSSLGVRRVPNARLSAEAKAVELLDDETLATAGDLQEAVRRAKPGGFDPEDFWAFEKDLPYKVEVVWNGSGEDGFFDVLLRHRERPGVGEPAEIPAGALASYANSPIREQLERRLAAELKRFLEAEVPGSPLPTRFVFVETL